MVDSFKDYIKAGLFPFDSRRKNALVWVVASTLFVGLGFVEKCGYNEYKEHLTDYKAGRIDEKPSPNDYGFLGPLGNRVFGFDS